jgi:hypothetical protein
MQAHVDKIKEEKERDLESTRTSQTNLQFDFKPIRARSVPDFRRLQKAFITKMEKLKKGKKPTQFATFKFSQPRPSAHLQTHMDQQNQAINPTMRQKRAHSATFAQPAQ